MMKRHLLRISVGGIFLLVITSMHGQSIRWLGTLGGIASGASGVSADGAVVAGWSYDSEGWQRAVRWTSLTGIQYLVTHGVESYALSISADGTTIVGWMGYPDAARVAFRWTAHMGVHELSGTNRQGEAYGVSANGRVITGWMIRRGLTEGFYYRWGEGIWSIPNAFGDIYTQAYGISGDGSRVVGWAYWYPHVGFVWDAYSGQFARLGGSSESSMTIAYNISADGQTAVGVMDLYKRDGEGNVLYDENGEPIYVQMACRWQAPFSNTFPEPLGFLPSGDYSEPYACSEDGSTVIGIATDHLGRYRAFRWTSATGIQDLNAIYRTLLYGSSLDYASAISLDGRYIVGGGFNAQSNRAEAFLLDTWRHGDTDGDGCVGDSDLLRVLFSFGSSGTGITRHEDINDDGIVDDEDLLIVLFNFGSGC